VEELLRVDNHEWLKEADSIAEFFKKFDDRLPHALVDELDSLRRRLTGQ